MAPETYSDHVAALESRYASYAFTSQKITVYATGSEAIGELEAQWQTPDGRARLVGRTPMSLERDRILYSDALRRQADKHHVLFWNQQRVTRNYTNHTLRIAQVSRSIASRLTLNSELAEAIALGAKVGGVSFLHEAKSIVSEWVQESISEMDRHSQNDAKSAAAGPSAAHGRKGARQPGVGQEGLTISADNELVLPSWIHSIRSDGLKKQVMAYLPWAAGDFNGRPYTSGQESYWMLATDPFQERARRPYLPQTLYGIWRHSLQSDQPSSEFDHKLEMPDPLSDDPKRLEFSDQHLTHEAVVVRFADDITWVIENLSEATRAAALDGKPFDVMGDLGKTLRKEGPPPLVQALASSDTGFLYTFFIDDLVRSSQARLDSDAGISETEPSITLSPTGELMLRRMKGYLEDRVFSQNRTTYRNSVLGGLTRTVLEVLLASSDALESLTKRRSRQDGWSEAEVDFAIARLSDPVKRIQTCVDLLVSMSDREIYDFIGLG